MKLCFEVSKTSPNCNQQFLFYFIGKLFFNENFARLYLNIFFTSGVCWKYEFWDYFCSPFGIYWLSERFRITIFWDASAEAQGWSWISWFVSQLIFIERKISGSTKFMFVLYLIYLLQFLTSKLKGHCVRERNRVIFDELYEDF
jgi:hypothetical protein